ncbi:MAG: Gfo/Idh/MocA family oxidoreductase [Candidatus Sumerlaeota bacterium]|nr:Gfo/Idh/MocA family oxidoreductase [Candidatus Sumerlaeota bacterium]
MNCPLRRRRFIATAAAGAAGLLILRDSRSAWSYQANEKLNVALIGCGGRGQWFVDTIPRMENIVALCDVNDLKLADAFKRWEDTAKRFAESKQEYERAAASVYKRLCESKPKTYSDFRKMLEERKDIDAVIVATPDHTHAVAAAAAMQAGKHVFCEKPLTRTVHESRALRELARKRKVATAMGNQGTYSGPFRRALELIRSGAIGEIKEVHVWNTAGGADRKDPPKGEEPVPENLKWDLWLGPAAMRPFNKEWLKRNLWRDFGTCQLGNWAPHSANLAFMALKVHDLWLTEAPPQKKPIIRVEAKHTGINKLSFPQWELINWEIPARAEFPPITITWYNGKAPGARELIDRATQGATEKDKNLWDFAGAFFVGAKGNLHSTGHNSTFRLLPEDQFKETQRDRPETVEGSRGCEQDFFAACRGGKPAWSNFDYASALIEFLMLGNVATQFEGKLEFDPAAMKIVNNPEADAALRCEYRKDWTL